MLAVKADSSKIVIVSAYGEVMEITIALSHRA